MGQLLAPFSPLFPHALSILLFAEWAMAPSWGCPKCRVLISKSVSVPISYFQLFAKGAWMERGRFFKNRISAPEMHKQTRPGWQSVGGHLTPTRCRDHPLEKYYSPPSLTPTSRLLRSSSGRAEVDVSGSSREGPGHPGPGPFLDSLHSICLQKAFAPYSSGLWFSLAQAPRGSP